MKLLKSLALGLMFALSVAACQPAFSYVQQPLVATIDEVYDGDTIFVILSEFPDDLSRIGIRVLGIDTGELNWRAQCDAELEAGEESKRYLIEELIMDAEYVVLSNYRWDKYGGRMLADVLVNGWDIGHWMLEEGGAIEYWGGTKTSPWCE